MQTVQLNIKREERRSSESVMAVAENMDSDSDDSVVHVPFVKPAPPVISLDVSDSEEEKLPETEPPPESSVSRSSSSVSEIISSEHVSFTSEEPITGTPETERRKKKKSKTKEGNAKKKEKQVKNKDKSGKKKKKGDNNSAEPSSVGGTEQNSGCSSEKSNKKKSTKKKDKSTNAANTSTGEVILNGANVIPGGKELSGSPAKEATVSNKRKKRSSSENDLSSSSPTKKGPKKKNPVGSLSELEDPVQVLGHAPSIIPRKKRRRKDSVPTDTSEQLRNLTPADIDHLNFLKTLNLTGNIGFNEVDLLNLALSPADFRQPSLSSLIDTPNSNPMSSVAPVSSSKTGEHISNHDETSSISSVSSDATVAGAGPESIPATPESSSSTAAKPLKKKSKDTPSKSLGFVSVVEERFKSKKKNDLSSSNPATAPKPVTTENSGNEDSDDETDRVGIFTAKELKQVRSHLQLHVTGVRGLVTTGKDSAGSKGGREISSGKRKKVSDYHRQQRKKRKSEGEGSEELMRPPKSRPKATAKSVNTPRLMMARDYPSTWTSDMIDFYGKVDPQVPDIDEVLAKQSNSPRIWRIPVDMEPSRLKAKHFKCDNCNHYVTHPSDRCPHPKRQKICVMCGEMGHETNCMYPPINQHNLQRHSQNAEFSKRFITTSCSMKMCLNCGKSRSGKSDRDFVQKCDACWKGHKQKCVTCEGRHLTNECPDKWRRFHSVCAHVDDTKFQKFTSSNLVDEPKFRTEYKPKEQTFCCNCAKRGHNYYDCQDKTGFNSAFLAIEPLIQVELPLSIAEPTINTERASKEVPPVEDQTSLSMDANNTVTHEILKQTEQSSSLKEVQQKKDSSKAVDTPEILVEKTASASPVTITIEDDIEIIELDDESPTKDFSSPKTPVCNNSSVSTSLNSTEKNTVAQKGVLPAAKDIRNQRSTSENEGRTILPSNNTDKMRAPSIEENLSTSWIIDRNPWQPQDKHRSEERAGSSSHNRVSEDRRSKSTPPDSGDHRKGATFKEPKGKDQTQRPFPRCRDFPDCHNTGYKACLKINLSKSEHKLVLKFDQEKRIVEKLNQLYSHQKISICLMKQVPEFHIAGDKNYLPRDRILRLVKDLAESRDISKLLPGTNSSPSKEQSSASANKDRSTASTNKERSRASMNKEQRSPSTTKERNSSGTDSDRGSSSKPNNSSSKPKDGVPKCNQESFRSSEEDVKEASVSSTTVEVQAIIQKVVFDPKSLKEYENPPSIEEIPVGSPPIPASLSVKETLPAKEIVTSTSDDSEKRSSAPLSNYAFERKLRKLVCSVPLSSTPAEDNSQTSGKVAQVTSSTDPSSRNESLSATKTSPNSSMSRNMPSPKPLLQKPTSNDRRNFPVQNHNPNDRRNSSSSRFVRNDSNYNNRNQNEFGDSEPRNYYNNFPDYSYPNPQFMNMGAPMGFDTDERNLPYEERQLHNQFMSPNSPFYFRHPWPQDNFPGMYGQPPAPMQQPQFQNFSNDDFWNDNYQGFNGPQHFGNFCVDRQPTYQHPIQHPPPRNTSAPIRYRGRGRGFNNNTRRR